MNENTTYPYVVGIPRLINKQSRDFEQPPSFFLNYGTKSNTASSVEHFATREDCEQAILRYHRGLIESGYLDNDDIVPFYGIGKVDPENSRQPFTNWQYFELIPVEESHGTEFSVSPLKTEETW